AYATVRLDNRARQGGAERVAGLLGSHDRDRERLAGAFRRRSHYLFAVALGSRTPITKIFSRSADSIVSCACAIIVLPAVTASPARLASAASAIVRGPIEGRSKRRSCPGFGALTKTPAPAGAVTRPSRRNSTIRASM